MSPFMHWAYGPFLVKQRVNIECRVRGRRQRNSPARNIVHHGNRDSPAPHNAARINGNPPADNAARNNRNPPADNAARNNRNPPADNAARDNRNPPADNAARNNRNSSAHNAARSNRNSSAHNAARSNRGSPMADTARVSDLPVEQGKSFYFAYGSNMHVSQMADRCPRSRFVGPASLPGYRWQINEKGIANIVPSPNDRVEGLVYQLAWEDEKSLDRIEAVSKKLYERQFLPVDLTPHPTLCKQKSWLVAAELAGQRQPGQGNNAVVVRRGDANLRPGRVKALVYISEQYKVDGEIRSEYINRMQKGIVDGQTLGIPASYVDKCLSPLVNPRPKVPAHKRIEPRRQGSR
ncbi:hypothetical protein MY4824_002049 [Beauveria thailandica]